MCIRRCGDRRKEMQFSVHFSLCGCDARIENEIICHEPGISALFSRIRKISGGETNWENQIGPWRFRGIQGKIST